MTAAAVLALAALAALVTGGQAKPHILLVAVDDLGWADSNIMVQSNETDIQTPHLRELADSGVRLGNYYTQTVCSPTRTSLMTGMFPFRVGMQHSTTLLPGTTAHLPLGVPTIAELLRANSYRTHMIGKWHLGYAKRAYTPAGRGFERFYGYLQGQEDYFNKTTGSNVGSGYDFWENHDPVPTEEGTAKYSLDQYADKLDEMLHAYLADQTSLEERAARPFFLYMSHQTVHIPLQARNEDEPACSHITNIWRRRYCSMLIEMDKGMGEMVQKFKDAGLWNNTIMLLTTDNGGMTFWGKTEDGTPTWPASVGSNWPLRGSKSSLFEGGVRGTAFITGGEAALPKLARGTTYNGLMHAVDLNAIALAAAFESVDGQQPSPGHRSAATDGINLLPAMMVPSEAGGAALPARTDVPININYNGKKYTAIRFGEYKLIVRTPVLVDCDGWFPIGAGDREEAPARKGPYMLFHIASDPDERNDIAAANPRDVAFGLDLIKNYMSSGYQSPQPNLPHVRALPWFHGGRWAPFLGDDELVDPLDLLQETSPLVTAS